MLDWRLAARGSLCRSPGRSRCCGVLGLRALSRSAATLPAGAGRFTQLFSVDGVRLTCTGVVRAKILHAARQMRRRGAVEAQRRGDGKHQPAGRGRDEGRLSTTARRSLRRETRDRRPPSSWFESPFRRRAIEQQTKEGSRKKCAGACERRRPAKWRTGPAVAGGERDARGTTMQCSRPAWASSRPTDHGWAAPAPSLRSGTAPPSTTSSPSTAGG